MWSILFTNNQSSCLQSELKINQSCLVAEDDSFLLLSRIFLQQFTEKFRFLGRANPNSEQPYCFRFFSLPAGTSDFLGSTVLPDAGSLINETEPRYLLGSRKLLHLPLYLEKPVTWYFLLTSIPPLNAASLFTCDEQSCLGWPRLLYRSSMGSIHCLPFPDGSHRLYSFTGGYGSEFTVKCVFVQCRPLIFSVIKVFSPKKGLLPVTFAADFKEPPAYFHNTIKIK